MGMLPPGSDRSLPPDALIRGGHKLDIKVTPATEAHHPLARMMLAFFSGKQRTNALPSRTDLPHRDLLPVLPFIFMLEPTGGDMTDWRFRLVGHGITARLGGDPTGLCISEIYKPAQVAPNAASYADVATSRAPHITTGSFHGIDREFLTFEIVHLPMLGNDERTIWVLGGLFFND